MEQVIPIEECAKQRLQVLVNAYTLFIKGLMEEGVDREKVQRASDKVWTILGRQAAEQLRPVLGETITIESLQQAGAIAENVHGMEVSTKIEGNEFQSKFESCPWSKAMLALDVPEEWRFCISGHIAFVENMYKGLEPNATYKLLQKMPAGDEICEARSAI